MDIELQLRQRLVLRDPGPRFTDGVMSKLGDAPDGAPREGVVQLSEVRHRQRGRRLLVVVVLVAAAAAATLPFMHGRNDEAAAEVAMPSPPIEEPLAGDLPVTDAAAEPASPASSLEDCVDPHVLFGLMLPFETGFKVVSTPPGELVALQPPRELAWLGGVEHVTATATTLSAVYRTNLPRDAARAAMASALVAAGWKAQPTGFAPTYRNVFVSAGSPGMSERYCREGRPVALTSSVLEGVTYVVLSRQAGAGITAACGRPSPQVAGAASPLDEFLPRLELPLDPSTGRPVAMRGGGGVGSTGGSRWNRRSNVSFRFKGSLDSIASHFTSQLAAQGWRPDAGWSGAVSAGSTWVRRIDDDTLLEGILTVSAFGNDRYTAAFRAGQVN